MPAQGPLRLCLVIPTLDRGGAEKQLMLLATGLDRRLVEPHVVTLTRTGPLAAELERAQVLVTNVGKRWKFDPLAYRRLYRLMRSLKPDVVHTWLFAANAYGRLAALRAKVPVVLGGERSVDPWKRTYEFWIDRWLSRRTSGILTNSQGVKQFYVEHGIDASQFHIVPNGQPERVANEITRQEFCRRLGVTEDRTYLAAVGRLWPQKGYQEMLWSLELLRIARPDALLIIIGDGPQRQRLEQYRDQIQVAHHVKFVGERNDVAELLPHFSLFLNTSRYEGQSNSIMEAMQAGVPVVATDIPGNRDLIVTGQTGLLVPVEQPDETAKSMKKLLDDPKMAESFRIAAKARIRTEFSVQSMVARHQELYQKLLQSSLART